MRSPVAELLAALAAALDRLGVAWYLFGAQAALLYGAARLTADVDVTVRLGDRPTSALVDALVAAGFELRVRDVHGFVERTRVLPLAHRPTGIPVDIVLAGPGPEELFLARARQETVEGVAVKVASPEDVVAMKVLAIRDLALFQQRWPAAVRSLITGRYPVEAYRDLLLGPARGIKNVLTFA